VNIPFDKLIQQLHYKLGNIGIKVIETGESYTSKVDSLALEPIKKQKVYLDKRIKRGLFQSSVGKLINSDVNGAINIGRKVVGDVFIKKLIDRGHAHCPSRMTV